MSNRPSEESEAARLKLRFKKTSDHTKVFEEWDASVKTFFRERAQFEDGELPIVAFFETNSCWFLITSRRLLWSNPDQTSYELRHDNVQSVGWSSGPDGWAGRDSSDPPDTVVYTAHGKGQCAYHSPWLHLIDNSGKRFEAFLEQGNLHGMRRSIWQLSAGWQNAFEKARQENQAAAATLPATGSDAYRARKLRINFERSREAEYYEAWISKNDFRVWRLREHVKIEKKDGRAREYFHDYNYLQISIDEPIAEEIFIPPDF